MPLSTKSVGATGESTSNHIKDGVFAELVRIIKIKDTSGQQLDWMSWSNDLSVYCELEGERELPFTPSFYVGGDFKKGPGGIDGWGGAFLVASFFKTLLGQNFELTPESAIPRPVLEASQGQQFIKVSFRSDKQKPDGTNKILDWNRIVVPEEGEPIREAKERAAEIFIANYLRSGYPSAYDRAGAIAQNSGESRDATPQGDGAGGFQAGGSPEPTGSNFAAQKDPDELPF